MFRDRSDAGQRLAAKLHQYAGRNDVLVLALPRGGVPVGYEVARELDAPLDIFLVRKLGVPGHEELAMGAIASGGTTVLNEPLIRELRISQEAVAKAAAKEVQELERREREYRDGRARREIRGKTVILVDDGLATGSTMRAAVQALRTHHPGRIIVAVPVGARETCREFEIEADEVACAIEPEPFFAVGCWYSDFSQTTDDEVKELLAESRSLTA